MNINRVIIAGNLTRDPEVRKTPSGQSVCDCAMAINEKYKTSDGKEQESTTYVDVVAWGKTADQVGQHLRKGSSVVIEGRLQLDQWEKDGQKRSKMRVKADRVQFGDRPSAKPSATNTAAPQPEDDFTV